MYVLFYGGVILEQSTEYKRSVMENYKKDVEPLFRYLSWLEDKKGESVSTSYADNGVNQHSMAFPVYDSTLVSFVKQVQKTKLINRNYMYIYSRYRIGDAEDELKTIQGVSFKNVEILTGILSKYVCGGMTKSWVWPQAVENGIFLAILLKFKELFEMWI